MCHIVYITLINTNERKIMSYDHKASTQKLNEIMATRTPGKQTVSKKADIVEVLKSIQVTLKHSA
jgi:hypothetical protein